MFCALKYVLYICVTIFAYTSIPMCKMFNNLNEYQRLNENRAWHDKIISGLIKKKNIELCTSTQTYNIRSKGRFNEFKKSNYIEYQPFHDKNEPTTS